ncbi:filamentous hemagglutinin N-terminal domain-containing protein [Caballeronia sp. LZ062]|uniref:filamentous hemagglutinin N-terminal domain-containing protein n=1 Tax=unclassified Caballeronia TaxID=2646786 RepID=UPI00285841D1|nr:MULTISPECIES: filamentous hemagglutinin N-terminal domain-containing protein [unclassified Caballeronia]MDR5857714.1 filamentous hemagglutinin N-terminal domain-containing protein [Caballeronia sp. LZ050]MDR5869264.1 filamentous hemagglutinin N-terminal domain-containing protein [Caballeronia sp. LZ062]
MLATRVWAAGPLPSGGQFVAGAGAISSAGSRMTVTQTTSRGVIDWCDFSIGRNNSVVVQNGTGATLSRVTGAQQSVLSGSLSATGSFYLINPQGVVIGPGGVVTTGGRFVASALDVGNSAFMAGGPLTFSGGGAGVVVNLGKISSTGGDVFLIARKLVANGGTISAPSGSAELTAGDQVLMHDSTGMPQTFVQSTGSRGDVVDKGTIAAAQIALQAADGNVYALAGHTTALRATGVATRDGHVWLVANNGTAHVHGRIDATNVDGTGATVDTTGAALRVSHADVHAANWNLTAPVFDVGRLTTDAFVRTLNQGTSVTLNASQGDIVMQRSLQWTGDASLTLSAMHSITVGKGATFANTGNANLTLRADSAGQNNGGSVTNSGVIDWSKSTGLVAIYRDNNGQYVPGQTFTNPAWAAPLYSGVKSQISSYVLVNSLTDLENMSKDLNGSYALGRDIDANTPGGYMQPIGAGTASGFTGQLDGLGHGIENVSVLTEDFAGKATGLFTTIGNAGVVRNLKLTNENVTVYYDTAGALAGQSSGLVSNVVADGRVMDLSVAGMPVGGLIGNNSGVVYRGGSAVSAATESDAGGLVGVNSGTILQSYATGGAGGGSRAVGGGLVGDNSGSIKQSYAATGFVGGGGGAGGLVGYNSGSIEQSFASGPVDTFFQPLYRAGIAVFNSNTSKIASDVFWDVQSTRQTSEIGSATPVGVANGLTTAQMKNPASFGPTWDFGAGGTWVILPNDTHPILRWQVAH